MRKPVRALSLLAAVALGLGSLVLSSAPASAAAGDLPCVQHAPGQHGHIGGIVRQVKHVAKGHPCPPTYRPIGKNDYYYPGTTPPLIYNGGPVMATSGPITVTPIYWAPSGYTFPSTYQSVLNTFLANVAADSGKSTNVFSPLQQWTSSSGHVRYRYVAATALSDSTPFPTSGCSAEAGSRYPDGSGFTSCVTDPQVQTELLNVVRGHSLPSDLNHVYAVFLPKGVESCFGTANGSQGGDCTSNSYCAYHTWQGSSTAPLIDALMPFALPSFCTTTIQSPNGDSNADIVTSPLSHELNEAASDPLLNAWYDTSGYENGDECAYIYGTASGTSGAQYNQTINGAHYFLQEEFSNEDYATNSIAGCVQKEESPTASFTVNPSSPGVNQTATFDGSASVDKDNPTGITSYSWTFGDGGTSTSGPTTTHAFAAAGTYAVKLQVRDGLGYTGSVTHSVTVTGATPPTVIAKYPAAGATNIGVGSATAPKRITAQFNEPVTGVSASSFQVKLGTASVAGTLSYDGSTNTATFTPSGALTTDSHYTVSLTSDIKNASGTSLAPLSWTFSTGPRPTVKSVTPASGATGVPIGSASTPTLVKAVFSESVTGVSGASFTVKAGTSSVAGAVTYASGTATFTPSGALAPNTTYTVALTSAIKDLAGNPLSAYTWSFTTGAS
ncbi:Ig-like domain-containing protein [Amnibacterium sp. CER49]|uniref:Ig-like domain-containing protein n=1 Tax=Amnibacterium sp. CER49 TaxID=3039161 RepID=UPI002448E88B|nr:Ig-like domain-containing protein [Amnibacterium sp. CER49]MDH2443020.1 Ig-like domain-containing protein [Amnibacterium sp. CER49]